MGETPSISAEFAQSQQCTAALKMEHSQGGGGCFIQTQKPAPHTSLSVFHTDLEAAGGTVALQVAGVSFLRKCRDV